MALLLAVIYLTYSSIAKQTAQEVTTPLKTIQMPFERFKAAMSVALTTPNSSFPKPQKKSRNK